MEKPLGDDHRRTFGEVEGPTPDCQEAFHIMEGTLFSFHLYFHIFFSIHVCAMKKISGFLYVGEGSIFRLFHYFRRPTLGLPAW